jgi:NADPH2:quinone reductase
VRLQDGATVLVHAAARGVGTAAIQVARALGARVVAAVGSEEKHALCRDLGADEAYVYDEIPPDLRVDVVVDPSAASCSKLRWGGSVRSASSSRSATPRHVAGATAGADSSGAASACRACTSGGSCAMRRTWCRGHAGVARPLASRGDPPVVGAEFPLAEVEDAHELVESRRSVGKVVLVP